VLCGGLNKPRLRGVNSRGEAPAMLVWAAAGLRHARAARSFVQLRLRSRRLGTAPARPHNPPDRRCGDIAEAARACSCRYLARRPWKQ